MAEKSLLSVNILSEGWDCISVGKFEDFRSQERLKTSGSESTKGSLATGGNLPVTM